MRILIKSLYLFIFGIYIDSRQKNLDSLLKRHSKKYGVISSPNLVHSANRCYKLYAAFYKYECALRQEMVMKSLLEKNI